MTYLVVTQQLDAGHDSNGNPRRLQAVYTTDTGSLVGLFDEGFAGRRILPEQYRAAPTLPSWRITPGEYRQALREWRQRP